MKKLFIIIATFNPQSDFLNLLKKLAKEKIRNYQINIVIVDNKSTSRIIEDLQSTISNLRIIKNRQNLGFAAGCNLGIKYALKNNAAAILLLNQDVLTGNGFLQLLINSSADIVAPVIKFKRDTQWVYDYGGKINWWWGRTEHVEKISNFKLGEKIDYVSGCCMLIRRKVFEQIGLLDEKYFLYFEDVDFCLRAKRAGLTIAVEPSAMIIHNLVEGREKLLRLKLQLIKSNFIFINKYLGWHIPLGYLYLLALTGKIIIDRLFE